MSRILQVAQILPRKESIHGKSTLACRGATHGAKRRGTYEWAGRSSPEIGVTVGAETFNVGEGYRTPPKNGRGEGAPTGVQGARHVQRVVRWKLGDLEGASPSKGGRQPWERDKRYATAVAFEKSDEAIVPRKSAKTLVTLVESMEGRAEAAGKSAVGNARSTQSEVTRAHAIRRVGGLSARAAGPIVDPRWEPCAGPGERGSLK